VAQRLLLYVHHVVVVVDVRELHVEHRDLGDVSGGREVLRAERGTRLVDGLVARRHQHLLVQLGALRQERVLIVVEDREQLGAALGAALRDERGLDVDEPLVVEPLLHRRHQLRAKREHRERLRLPEVERTVVEPGREVDLDVLRDLERERGVGLVDDFVFGGRDFDAAGRLVALQRLPDDADDVLGAGVLNGLEQLRLALLFEDDLDESLAVAHDEEDEASPRSRISWTWPAMATSSASGSTSDVWIRSIITVAAYAQLVGRSS